MAAKIERRRPRALGRGREEHPAPDARPFLEGASGDARCAAPVIHLRSYAQKKPIDEYKQEAFLLFERLLVAIREEVTRVLMRAQVQLEPPPPPVLPDFITQHLDPFSGDDDSADIDAATRRDAVRTCRRSTFRSRRLPLRETASWPRRRSAATRRARAGRAGSTSIATGSSAYRGEAAGGPGRPHRASPRLSPRRGAGRRRTDRQARLSADELGEATATARALVKGVRAHKPSGSTPSCTPTTSAATRALR